MRNLIIIFFTLLFSLSIFYSCLSETEKREKQERKLAVELAQKQVDEQVQRELARQEEVADSLEAERIVAERIEKEIYDKYIDNRLLTGATPYAYMYGRNKECNEWGCSEIKVTTPSSSEVIVIIKKNDVVVRHAYIRSSDSFTFYLLNGTYQPFFYYGNGWNQDKEISKTDQGVLKGGFVSGELFSKDNPQTLDNNILEYELVLQKSGNFSTQPSSVDEIF